MKIITPHIAPLRGGAFPEPLPISDTILGGLIGLGSDVGSAVADQAFFGRNLSNYRRKAEIDDEFRRRILSEQRANEERIRQYNSPGSVRRRLSDAGLLRTAIGDGSAASSPAESLAGPGQSSSGSMPMNGLSLQGTAALSNVGAQTELRLAQARYYNERSESEGVNRRLTQSKITLTNFLSDSEKARGAVLTVQAEFARVFANQQVNMNDASYQKICHSIDLIAEEIREKKAHNDVYDLTGKDQALAELDYLIQTTALARAKMEGIYVDMDYIRQLTAQAAVNTMDADIRLKGSASKYFHEIDALSSMTAAEIRGAHIMNRVNEAVRDKTLSDIERNAVLNGYYRALVDAGKSNYAIQCLMLMLKFAPR